MAASSRKVPPEYYQDIEPWATGEDSEIYVSWRRCVLKCVIVGPDDKVSSEEKLNRQTDYKKEIAALKKVAGDRHFVEYKNDFIADNRLWLELEFCNGGTLNEHMLEKEKPTRSQKKTIMSDISAAIAILHKKRILHRNLTPENIMIRKDKDNNPHAKVGDFGNSETVASSSQLCSQVSGWVDLSKPRLRDYFMAPEVFEGNYLDKSDVFSMGVIFRSMIPNPTSITYNNKKIMCKAEKKDDRDIPLGKFIDEKNEEPGFANTATEIGDKIRELINTMLCFSHKRRISASQIEGQLADIESDELSTEEAAPVKTATPKGTNAETLPSISVSE